MEWNDRYSVGNELIDDQHKELFQRVNRLGDALARGDRSEVGRMLEFLGDYVVRHFRTEEGEMARTRFPLSDVHKSAHDRFVRDFQSASERYASTGATPWLADQLNGTVTEWLVQHIIGMDQLLGAYIAAVRDHDAAVAGRGGRPTGADPSRDAGPAREGPLHRS